MPAQVRVDRLKPIYSAAKGLNFGFRMRAFPDAPAHNGVAAYQPQLLRLTIRFCKQSECSVGVRNFIESELVRFGQENPATVVYVIPTRNTIPSLRGEYSNGRAVSMNIKSFSLDRVKLHINYLRTRSGMPIQKYEVAQTSQCKSVQGMWSPVLWVDSRQNAVHGQLPRPEFSLCKDAQPKSATEYVLEKFVEQNAKNLIDKNFQLN